MYVKTHRKGEFRLLKKEPPSCTSTAALTRQSFSWKCPAFMVTRMFNYTGCVAGKGGGREGGGERGGGTSLSDRLAEIPHLSKAQDAPVTAHLITSALRAQPGSHAATPKIKMNFLATQLRRQKKKKKRCHSSSPH